MLPQFPTVPFGDGGRFLLVLVATEYSLPVNQYFDGTGKKDPSQRLKNIVIYYYFSRFKTIILQ